MKDQNNAPKRHKLIEYANGPSLEEINGTVEVPKGKGFWRTLFAYSGPGALVAVGYMDPGNWSTSITGGQNFPWIIHRISKKQRNPTIHTGLRCFGVSPIGCAYMLRLSQRKPSRKRGFTPSQL